MMKKFDIKVTSQEIIKPSSPTPDHLRHHKLSFLDQTQPPMFVPFIMFYPYDDNNNNPLMITNSDRSKRIKQSLSRVLAIFYPLAGRIKNYSHVECNDQGALFVEAQADCDISHLLRNPHPHDHNRFFPFPLDTAHELPFVVQLTFFRCGGMALFYGMSHKVGDGSFFFNFINSWAAISRGETRIRLPSFNLASVFPPKPDLPDHAARTGIRNENVVSRRFVFDAAALEAIRAKCTDKNSASPPPSRMVALSSFLWSRFVRVTETGNEGTKRLYTLLHAVDFSPRLSPPIRDFRFGNTSGAVLSLKTLEKNQPYHKIASRIGGELKEINDEYIKKLQESNGELSSVEEGVEEIAIFGITSWCRFPTYEADFGWGKPIWVGLARLPYKNVVVLLDTKDGTGMEAWVNLTEEDMSKLEGDRAFMSSLAPASYPDNTPALVPRSRL